jgi:hypothetical protein
VLDPKGRIGIAEKSLIRTATFTMLIVVVGHFCIDTRFGGTSLGRLDIDPVVMGLGVGMRF